MSSIAYVDVFTDEPTRGNPVAVVLGASDWSTDQMQRFAAWTNLSETTFVTNAQGPEYSVRIFTPRAELLFAGHPTVGTAWALLEEGRIAPKEGRLIQNCGVGAVGLNVDEGRIFVSVPRRGIRPIETDLSPAFGSGQFESPRAIDVGPVWLVARVAEGIQRLLSIDSKDAGVEELERRHGLTGVTLYAIEGTDVVVRSFAPGSGISEDPVCGSGNAATALHIDCDGLMPEGRTYVARQGQRLGRDGRVFVRFLGDALQIGGHAVTLVQGRVSRPN
jgi:PhzF family phenazine biosynthesis protein